MALSMARPPQPPSRSSSLRNFTPFSGTNNNMERTDSTSSQFALYKGVSKRPLGWKRSTKNPELRPRNMSVRKWDGATRTSTEWDGLRRDPELWFPEGNCNVHLYGKGQSRRGPAFKVPMEALMETNCRPLMHRFLAERFDETPSSVSSNENSDYFNFPMADLYIPAPPTSERGQSFIYHTATRNFFAWMFGKSLVGTHLGGALVGLLNSMNEFRSSGEDNVEAIIEYMDEEGYADMRNQPDHALAILFFAEHFHFKDLWIDAFSHCVGMTENLAARPGYEFISRTSRAFITRSRLEMDMRLDDCGRRLGTFLEEDLCDARLGLSTGARTHLDKFRSFLQSHFVAKLGYYPPTSSVAKDASFPKNIYGQMCSEFQKLYDFLVDTSITVSDSMPLSQQGGICVLQNVQFFDQRHKYEALLHPVPLLPEIEKPKPSNKRFTWNIKADKMKPDQRLVAFSALSKATNRRNSKLQECSLVRAYRGFEKECVFSPTKTDKNDKLSQTDARKVRWILVYTILQTLLSATRVPEEVRDIHNVPYNMCVLTAGCPPWKEERPLSTLLRSQTDQAKEEYRASLEEPEAEAKPSFMDSIKPDIDYTAIVHKPQLSRVNSESTLSMLTSRKGTVRRALSSLGNMPELHHPRPKRASYHEILVHGYGNGTHNVSITTANADGAPPRKSSTSSESSSAEGVSSRWSNSSDDAEEPTSPATTNSTSGSRRGSAAEASSKNSIRNFLDGPLSTFGLRRMPSSVYTTSVYAESVLQPDPLLVRRGEEQYMKVTKDVTVEWEDDVSGKSSEELNAYLET
ncbi:hypothetical protein LSUE1_G007131 [Lachnellula suecica]|uniref:DUF8004 domain-containing protein n=1 Tax=Lachnellula suecica TaxID=602035 RepID=A0A8T9C254_9HELO|nr:hypothetical protein LSUE1_G007131 [Lachnellula suecica]